jgi:carbon monoxide dehydrogenase subunit G
MLGVLAALTAGALVAPAARAAGNTEVFAALSCRHENVPSAPVGQGMTCEIEISHIANPNENIPSGIVTFSDSRGTGVFSPSNTCTLRPTTPFASRCELVFSSATAGGRTITAEYPGDASNKEKKISTAVKIFLPNSIRFAAPGGKGADPCTDRANPCSLFTAASERAPGTSIVPGLTVVLEPGTYTDFGSSGGIPLQEVTLERGITFRGEAGAPKPVLSFSGSGRLNALNSQISHIEIVGGEISSAGGTVDEIVARSSAEDATTCSIESGILRDSACISTGKNANAAGTFFFTERGESTESRFRNVTAISTGPESSGMHFSIQSLGPTSGSINVDAGSVIAKGTKNDVLAETTDFGAPLGSVHVALDHSDYATVQPKDPTSSLSITPSGDLSHSNITAEPLLSADHIHETFSSPTIDKGAPDGVFGGVIDVDGEARKQGAEADIGADEITPPNTTETKLSCNATSVFSGEATKCTATVTDTANHNPASSLAGGTVNFKDNTQSGTFNPATCTLAAISTTQASCQAEVDFKPTTVGNHPLEASFATDGKGHAGSTGTLSVQVKALPNDTETKLSCKATTVVSNETTQCTATVTDTANHNPASSLAGGTVNFKDNTQSGTFTPATCTLAAISSTQASCQTEVQFKPTTVGNHPVEGTFVGNEAHVTSTGTLSVQVKAQPNGTETKLSCKVTTLITGETTKCTATVSDKADNGPAKSLAGGTVNFKDNTQSGTFNPAICTLAAISTTQASCQAEVDFKPTTVGNHSLEGIFVGDEAHVASTGTFSVQVKAQPNGTETKLSCKVPTLITGETTKCTATVADNADHNPASPLTGGTVTFKDNTEGSAFAPPATCTLVGVTATQATCQVEVDFKPTTVANHALEASYPGDGGTHAPSTGTLTFQVKAQTQPNGTETKLTCKATSVVGGETTKCNATVTDKANNGPPVSLAGGIVTFKDNTEPAAFPQPASCQLGTISATQAGCQIEVDFKPTTIANHALEASYPSDGAHTGSTGNLSVQVKAQSNDTETKLSCKASPLIGGETTQCTATVTDKANRNPASSLGGDTVTFKDNTQASAFNLTTCTLAVLSTTTATCQVEVDFKPTTVGNHALEATFAGDGAHATSTGTLTVQVKSQPNHTETKLSCKASSLIPGEATHCTATVTDNADNGAPSPPSGIVTFKDNTQAGTFTPASCQLQTAGANVASCQAEVDFRPTTVANHQLEASFPTDGAHLASTGNLSVQVKAQPNDTETKLTCKAPSVVTGGATNCTAAVTDNANHNPATSLAGGTVTFKDNTEAGTFSPATCTLTTISATQASCQTEVDFNPTTVGNHGLEATYSGDGGAHAVSSGALTIQVNAQPNDTETELTCKAPSLITGEATSCTATVTDNANHNPATSLAGGTVTFKDNTEAGTLTPATCALVTKSPTRASCQAEVEFKPTAVTNHALEASYAEDGGNHAASAGTLAVEVHAVQPPPPPHTTKTTLVCNPASVVLGAGASQCTATVEDTAAVGASHPGGEVKIEILSGEGVLSAKACSLPDNGQIKASCQVTYTPGKAGDQELRATYQVEGAHAQSAGTAKLAVSPSAVVPPPVPPTTPPNTTLGKKPSKKTSARQALFSFSSDQPGSTFQCKLDKKPAKPCRSPFKVKVLPGRHTLTVQAINAQGVADPTPVVVHWTVGAKSKP